MAPSIYLINPACDFPTYFGAEVHAGLGLRPTAATADLTTATLAGMMPADFAVRICDEQVQPVDFDVSMDFVGITGKISQWRRMQALAREFRRRGSVVIIGGPFASLSPEAVRPHCDILVRGEVEEVFEKLCGDLRAGSWNEEYVGGRPDLSLCSLPNWDLYPNERALIGTVQTSRGCPFECEFCDVIQYLGRKQRHKPISRVLQELDLLYDRGYRFILIADDNFTASRGHAREILEALRDWNLRREKGRVRFYTQVSIDAAKDESLLELGASAGLTLVFIGIETPNVDSLRETKKRQNVGIDLVEKIGCFLDHGIAVTGGMIVGFDSDGPDIFERQYEFAMRTGVPIFSLGALVAPAATPLHDRLAKAGRLLADGSEIAATPWATNIQPMQMSREELLTGLRGLCNRLYEPRAFGERILQFIDRLGKRRDPGVSETGRRPIRQSERDSVEVLGQLPRLGSEEAEMWSRILARLAKKSEATEFVMPMLAQYMQVRYMYRLGGFWEAHPRMPPRLADPPLTEAPLL